MKERRDFDATQNGESGWYSRTIDSYRAGMVRIAGSTNNWVLSPHVRVLLLTDRHFPIPFLFFLSTRHFPFPQFASMMSTRLVR